MPGRTLVGVLMLLSATSSLDGQSRPEGRSRIPAFDSVVALIHDSTLEPASGRLDLDVQVMIWGPTALLPVPFLRLTHTPGRDIQAQLFAWWLHPASVPPDRLPSERRCSVSGQNTPVCVAKVESVGGVDWGELLAGIFASRACSLWLSGPLSVTADAGDLVVRVRERGNDRYEEYVCNAPRGSSRPGARQAAQVMDVLEKAVAANLTSVTPVDVAYQDPAHLEAGAQATVEAFAKQVELARGTELFASPVVEVRNTPMLIFFGGKSNTIVVPWWETQSPDMRSVFRTFARGSDAEGEKLFRAFFNGFLVAHEAAHWFQKHANRREPSLYANENQANRIAVAFWRTQPGGEQFLAHLEKLATNAAAALPDPTPAGRDPIEHFESNYQTLGQDPLKYGYYQFRFMADALRARGQLDFATLIGKQPQ